MLHVISVQHTSQSRLPVKSTARAHMEEWTAFQQRIETTLAAQPPHPPNLSSVLQGQSVPAWIPTNGQSPDPATSQHPLACLNTRPNPFSSLHLIDFLPRNLLSRENFLLLNHTLGFHLFHRSLPLKAFQTRKFSCRAELTMHSFPRDQVADTQQKVLEYLSKKGYNKTEATLRKESAQHTPDGRPKVSRVEDHGGRKYQIALGTFCDMGIYRERCC